MSGRTRSSASRIRDPDLRRRLGAAAAEHARAQFDPLRNARAVESVYDSLLGINTDSTPLRRAERVAA